MERITADTFAKFNRTCEQERRDRAELFFERAKDPNNTVEQCRYWARRAVALSKPRRGQVVVPPRKAPLLTRLAGKLRSFFK